MVQVARYNFDHQAAEAAVALTARTGKPHYVTTEHGTFVVVTPEEVAA